MTLLEQLKADLMLMETNDRALSRLLSAKRDLLAWKNPPASVRPEYDACLKLLEDLPSRVECECCGQAITHVFRKGASIVGEECKEELVLGSCRRH